MHAGLAGGLVAALLGPATACCAADALQGSAALTTDYVHRGLSQSDGAAAVQGSLTWWHPTGAYVGAWASSIESANRYVYPGSTRSHGAQMELDLYAGVGRPVGPDWTLDLKSAAYLYPHDPAPVSYDYLEFSAGAAWRQHLYATLSIAPSTAWIARVARGRRTAVDAELAWQQPLTPWVSAMAGAGYRELFAPGPSSYLYGSLALAMQLHRASFELGWFTTDSAARELFGDRVAGSRVAFTATVSF